MVNHSDPDFLKKLPYYLFLLELSRARPSLRVLLEEATAQRSRDLGSVKTPSDVESFALSILLAGGSIVQADSAQVIGDSLVGAAFQLTYGLFESFITTLGLTPGPEIRGGAIINGEHLSRILWAARSAFAHIDEWRNKGDSGHRHAPVAFAILRQIGFKDPAKIKLYDVYELISGGSVDAFVKQLQSMASELAETTNNFVPNESMLTIVQNILPHVVASAMMMIGARAFLIDPRGDTTGEEHHIVFQAGKGDDAIIVPLAEGKISHPLEYVTAMKLAAIERLDAEIAEPHRAFRQRWESWLAGFKALVEGTEEDPDFHERLLHLSGEARELYTIYEKLPNPVEQLMRQRGVKSLQELHAVKGELLTDRGYRPVPYREIKADINRLMPVVDMAASQKTIALSPEKTPAQKSF